MEYNKYVQKVIKDNSYLEELVQIYSTDFPELFCSENPSENVCLEAIRENENLLAFIEKQTLKICLTAVKRDGLTLQFVKHPTFEIALEAVRNNPEAIEFVKPEFKEACDDYGVSTVVINDSMIGIEQYKDYKNIRFIVFNNAHIAIGARAFENCCDLTAIFFEGNCELIAAQAFSNCTALESVYVNGTLQKIGYEAFSGCRNLQTFKGLSKVSYVEALAFRGCSRFIPENLTQCNTIKEGAFSDCSLLKEIEIPADCNLGYSDGSCYDGPVSWFPENCKIKGLTVSEDFMPKPLGNLDVFGD